MLVELGIVCTIPIVLMGMTAFLMFNGITGWAWFLLASVLITAGLHFRECECETDDSYIEDEAEELKNKLRQQ